MVELLAVVAIIAVLALIGMPAYNAFMSRAAAAGCIGNLRNLGAAMTQYVADNNGRLPGPCFTGVNPIVKTTSGMQLAYELRNYLNVPTLTPTGVTVDCLTCPGVTRRYLPEGAKDRSEVNNYVIYSHNDFPSGRNLLNTAGATDPSTGINWTSGPFGRTSGYRMPGWTLAMLASSINTNVVDQSGAIPTLSTIPAVYEPNNDLANRGGNKWPWNVPTECPHGPNMNVLFFDWHVGQVPANAYSEKGTVWRRR